MPTITTLVMAIYEYLFLYLYRKSPPVRCAVHHDWWTFCFLKDQYIVLQQKKPTAVHSEPSMGFFFIISIKLRFFYHLLLVNQDINHLSYGYQCCYITLFQFCSNLIIDDAVAFCIWGIQQKIVKVLFQDECQF